MFVALCIFKNLHLTSGVEQNEYLHMPDTILGFYQIPEVFNCMIYEIIFTE